METHHEDLPKGAMTSFDELESNLGGDAEEIVENETKPFFMTRREIAEIAYNSSIDFQNMVNRHEDAPFLADFWDDLKPEEQEEYCDITLLALRMNKTSSTDDEFGRLVHSKRAMQYLLKGYNFSEVHNDKKKETYLVAPWESLGHERRAPLLMFKSVVKSLDKVWDNDNPFLARK